MSIKRVRTHKLKYIKRVCYVYLGRMIIFILSNVLLDVDLVILLFRFFLIYCVFGSDDEALEVSFFTSY